jgi:hypothetical protein
MVTADDRLYNSLKDGRLAAPILWVEADLGVPSDLGD